MGTGGRAADLTVAVAQPAGASPEVRENVSAHVRLASRAAERGARLVLFPELSLTGYRRDLTVRQAVDTSDPRLLPLQRVADGQAVVERAQHVDPLQRRRVGKPTRPRAGGDQQAVEAEAPAIVEEQLAGAKAALAAARERHSALQVLLLLGSKSWERLA